MVLPLGAAPLPRSARTLSIALLALIVVMMLAPTGALGRPSAPTLSAPAAAATSAGSPAAASVANGVDPTPTPLAGAIDSLAHGHGPAFGASLTCKATSSVNAQCAGRSTSHPTASASPRPDGTPALYGWQNASVSEVFGSPAASVDASMAWDAFDQEIVYFGGCNQVVCPDNQTWIFAYGSWFNETNYAAAPPAVDLASMTYDYIAHGVILFGGCAATVCPTNQTWAFQSGIWYNESAPFCFIGCFFPPPPMYGASMVFVNDSADNVTMLFGGCLDLFCFSVSNATWEWVSLGGLYGAWLPVNTSSAPSPRMFSGMAYDNSMGGVLLFGGCAGYFGSCSLNDTWEFYSGAWSNLTAYNTFFGSPTPPGRGGAATTYDAALSVVLLVGGYNDTGYFNDTWAWFCSFICGWVNATTVVNLPGPVYLAAISSESSVYAPVLFSGYCACTGYTWYPNTWVYEFGFSVNPTVTPNPSPGRQPVDFFSNITGGSAPYYGFWSTGDGGVLFSDGPYTYSTPGIYQANISLYDFYGVFVTWSVNVTITGTTAQAIASPAVTDVGVAVTLSTADATGGTAPYNYTWELGDGTFGWGASLSHAYTAAGTYQANLSVVDSTGLYGNSSVVVSVLVGPSLTLAATPAITDVGRSVSFNPTGTGGSAPYTYNWSFGDGGTSAVSTPTHTFATVGVFHVNATVTDSVGASASRGVTVTVNAAVTATANASASSVTDGTNVVFTAVGSAGTAPYTYSWVFGDGGRATGASVSHAYTAVGTYTAKVWVNDSVGGSVEKTVPVTVTAASGGSGNSNTGSSLPSWLWWVLIAVVILVVLGVVAMMMMRRRKPGAPAPMPPSGASGGTPPGPPPGASGPS
ncbi:MAG TPA: PKD domain-containing protein [Thermoplasmata archaeon]